MSFSRDGGALEIELGGRAPEDVERLEVWWPTSRLRDVTLIDTPGIESISTDLSARTLRVLTPDDDRPPVVDAVLYLLRHTHASDVRFLESFHDDELAHGTPMNAVGVLSRADEIGSCRLDALDVAARVAHRYQAEPRLRRLCPVIVPVAGLLGHAAVTLREPEYRALAKLATAPRAETDALLLTADRFAARPSTVPVTELERAAPARPARPVRRAAVRRADPQRRGAVRDGPVGASSPASAAWTACGTCCCGSSPTAAGCCRRTRR